MSVFILHALSWKSVYGGKDTTEIYLKSYSFCSKHKQQVGDFKSAQCWPKTFSVLQKWVVKLLLTSTMHGFKNTTIGFLCNKTVTANPQHIQSPRFMTFSKSFCNTKAKSMATSQGNRIFLSIFRGGHAVFFNCFIIWLYSSSFGLHVSQKSLHYSHFTSLAGSLIKLVSLCFYPTASAKCFTHSFSCCRAPG